MPAGALIDRILGRMPQSLPLQYGAAALAVIGATGLRLLFNPLLGDTVPFITYFFAITVAGWAGGAGPAVFAVIGSAIAAIYFFYLPPVHTLDPHALTALAIFMAMGGLIAVTCEAMKQAQRRAEQQARLLTEHGRSLERHMAELTQHKQSLDKSERRLAHALDATVEGLWDWNIRTGEVFFSRRWIESLGYSADDVPPHISFWEDIVHPDDMLRLRAALQAHWEGHTPMYQCENRLRMKTGEYRWNLDRGKVVERDAEGKPLRMVGTDTDITERKQVEIMLRESEQRLRAMFDQAAVGIALVDAKGRFLETNDKLCDLLGYGPNELHELTCADLTHPDDRPKHCALMKGLVGGDNRDYVAETRYIRRDGSETWVNVAMAALLRRDAPPEKLVAIIQDIDARKRAEQLLHDGETALRKTVADLEASRSTLQDKVHELEMFHDLVVGRELKLIQMEKEVQKLRAERTRSQQRERS
ncbi:PAS domain S-box protein [Candidatus Nitrospira bockiana]